MKRSSLTPYTPLVSSSLRKDGLPDIFIDKHFHERAAVSGNRLGKLSRIAQLLSVLFLGIPSSVYAQDGVENIVQDSTWSTDTVLNNKAWVNSNHTLENGSSVSFNTQLSSSVNRNYPKIVGQTEGVIAILANSADKPVNITGTANGDGKLPVVRVTNQGNEYYRIVDMGSEVAANYSIASYGENALIAIRDVNLDLDHVAEGMQVAEGGKITVDNDFIKITADHSDALQHHALNAQDGGAIDIRSKSVELTVSGKSTENNDPYTVFSSGIHTTYGGSIKVHADNILSITVDTVNTANDYAQNYGVYALGQYGKAGIIDLSGKDFNLNVSGSTRGSIGLVSAPYGQNASLSAKFENISITASGDGICGTTLNALANTFASGINVQADKLTIDAQNGIVATTRWGENTITTHAKELSVNSVDSAITNWSDLTQNNTASTNIKVAGNDITLFSEGYGVLSDVRNSNRNTSLIDVQGDTRLTIKAPYVAYSFSDGLSGTGEGTINLNTNGIGRTDLNGGIVALHNSDINIGLNTADSVWTGFAQDKRTDASLTGAINVVAKNGATWNVRSILAENDRVDSEDPKSYLTSWHSVDASRIDMTYEAGYQAVDIGTLTGRNTTFRLATDIDAVRGEGKGTDQAIVHTGSGNHAIMVESAGDAWKVEQADYLIWHKEKNGATSTWIVNHETGETAATGAGDLSFTLANRNQAVDAGVYQYKLATRDALDGDGTEWYLKRTDKPSSSADLVTSLPAIAVPGTLWWAQLSDLRKRLGEVRYGAQDGLWARAITWEDESRGLSHNGFHQKVYGLNLGLDHIVRQDEKSMWLIGGNLKTFHAEQDIQTRAGGDGETDSWGLNLYATWADWDGYYADFVLSYDHYDQKMHTTMTDWQRVRGDYNTYGLGASIEIGRMFSSTQDDEGWGAWYSNWFIEPQAQLAYYWVKGKDFTLDNGMQVSQGDGDSLTGRLGVVLGKKYNYGKNRAEVDKRYAQFYLEGGVKQELAGRQHVSVNDVRFSGDMGGTRIYYGAGFDWNLTDQTRLYAQIERENGDRYDRDYYLTAGIKYQY